MKKSDLKSFEKVVYKQVEKAVYKKELEKLKPFILDCLYEKEIPIDIFLEEDNMDTVLFASKNSLKTELLYLFDEEIDSSLLEEAVHCFETILTKLDDIDYSIDSMLKYAVSLELDMQTDNADEFFGPYDFVESMIKRGKKEALIPYILVISKYYSIFDEYEFSGNYSGEGIYESNLEIIQDFSLPKFFTDEDFEAG